jgi:hypothetical protein
MMLDHPDVVTKGAVLDIAPTLTMYACGQSCGVATRCARPEVIRASRGAHPVSVRPLSQRKIIARVQADHVLGHRRWLDLEKPGCLDLTASFVIRAVLFKVDPRGCTIVFANSADGALAAWKDSSQIVDQGLFFPIAQI